jgi:hypothetical protein
MPKTNRKKPAGSSPATVDSVDPLLEKLTAIHATLQDILIVQVRQAGANKARARAIAGVADSRVSRIWRELGERSDD